MKHHLKSCLVTIMIILAIIISFFLLTIYIIEPETPRSYQDSTVIPLSEDVDTPQEIYAFIADLMYERGMWAIRLNRIYAIFSDEQIKKQKGEWVYSLDGDDGKSKYTSTITVTVDMEKRVVTLIDVFYDSRTLTHRLKNGYLKDWDMGHDIDPSQWMLTIDDMFALIYERVGEDAFSKFNNSQLKLMCYFEDRWTLDVMQKGASLYAESQTIAIFDPIHEKIIEIEERWGNVMP